MDVDPGLECFAEPVVTREVREHAELDLGVVRDEEHLVGRSRDERPSDPATELRADRDVLQVRVGAAEASRRGRRLVEGRVHPAVARVDHPREGLEVGGVELVELAPRQERIDDLVVVPQLLQHRRVGRQRTLGGALAGLQPELVVQHLPQLRRRVEVELPAGEPVDLRRQRGHLLARLVAHLLEVLDIQADPPGLHPGEHGGERELDVLQQAAKPETVHLFVHGRSEQRDGRRVGGRRAPGILREQLTGFLLAGVADNVHAQVALAEDREGVGGRRGVQQVAGEHRVEGDGRDRSPLGEDRALERLGVVRPLRCGGVGER